MPNYINSKPTAEDQFEGKSHQRIANSIAEHIKDGNNSLKVLGLEGGWGTGKSTIIELIKENLSDTHHLYVYDCWGHQEDSQRRAFLEEQTLDLLSSDDDLLETKTEHIDLSGVHHEVTWTEKIKFLLAKKRETNQKTVPKLSFGIVIVGLIFIFTPILALISDILGDSNQATLLKLLFSASLLILSTTIWLLSTLYKRFISKSKKWINLSSLFYIYKGKQLEDTTLEIFSEIEPSVKEFKEWMHSISKSLKSKELIIVYDNMDRLPPENVKEIWSSIHTFFAEEKYPKITVIIPFDREHLSEAFKNGNSTTTNEFLNKTFSIIYRVSPPVLTDWKNFFVTKFKEAFGDSENQEIQLVLTIYDRLTSKFTPRDIILFINELVTLKRIWGEEIKLRYIAIFSKKKDYILENPQETILKNDYLDSLGDLLSDDAELQNNISALAFNVPLEKASQVLLLRDIELALRQEGQNGIIELSKHPYFIYILEEVIYNNGLEVDKAILELSHLEKSNLNSEILERLDLIWETLNSKQIEHNIESFEFDDKFKKLLQNISHDSQLKLLNHITSCYGKIKDFNGAVYYKTLLAVESFLNENSIQIELPDLLSPKQVEAKIFLDYLIESQSDYKRFKVKTEPSRLDSFVADCIKEDFSSNILDVNYNDLDSKNYSFPKSFETLETLISENTVTSDNFINLITLQKSFSKSRLLDQTISKENLHEILKVANEDFDGFYDVLCIRIKFADEYDQFISQNRQVAQRQNNRQLMNTWVDKTTSWLQSGNEDLFVEVAKRIEHYICYGDLLILTRTWGNNLVHNVCRLLTLNSYGVSRMNLNSVLPHFFDLVSSINVSENELLKRLDDWSGYVDKITVDNIRTIVPNHDFYKYSTSTTNTLTKHINAILKEYLNSISSEEIISDWANDESYIFNALYWLKYNSKLNSLPRNFFNAIKQVLKSISETSIGIPENETIWFEFIEMAKKKDIAPTIRDIRDYYIRENNISVQLFQFFSDFLKSYGKLSDKPGDITRTILGRIVSNDNCLKIITSDKDFYIPIIIEAKDDAADFKENILQRIESDSTDSELMSFAEKIGISVISETEEDKNEQ
ncbi:NTPase (plasmid) [Fulvitalea axinellae]|uniref:NTPase n=1 Tax=Fulvitalea axinellae TaxID=1182444 RepID=A0AAU9CQX4_9BACT|nr:NTPase [Fulvitalea axinellae]